MNTQCMIDYLTALGMNNNREWYHANKDSLKMATTEFENLLQSLMLEIGKFDSSILGHNPKGLTFKLVRDTVSAMTNRLIILPSVPIFPQKGSCPSLSAIIL